ncbi:hypothetical protein Tco_0386579 [Tanacetum coccineum]
MLGSSLRALLCEIGEILVLDKSLLSEGSDSVEDENSPEFQDTANSGQKKAMVFYQIDTEEVSDRFVAPCFVNGLEAYDGEINLGVEENMISNEYAVKLCLEHEVKRGNKIVKKELIVALRGKIYFVKFIINLEEDDVEPGVIFGRSFLRLTKTITDFGAETVTIYHDIDLILKETKEERKSNDDWDNLLDFNIDDVPLLDEEGLPPFVCKMGKSSRNKKRAMENLNYFYQDIGTSSSADKVELDGKIVKEYEEAVKSIKGEALKERDDPGAFIFPIILEEINENALADTGSDINTMPFCIYVQLGRDDMKKVDRGITMINHTRAEAMRILINVLCQHKLKWPNLDRLIDMILSRVLAPNPYVQTFRSLGNLGPLDKYKVELTASVKVDQRLYNRSTTSEVAGIWVESNENITTYKRSIVVYGRSEHPMHIQPYFDSYIRELVNDDDDVTKDEEADKLANPDHYDKVVCAKIPDPNKHPELHQLVLKHMIHGPLFNCHINWEVCLSIKSVTYVFKYVYKGHDKQVVNVDKDKEQVINDIKRFQDVRYVSPPEAMWRIYGFPLSNIHPSIMPLQVHLPNNQFITFKENDVLTDILKRERNNRSMLISLFELNQTGTQARQYLYKDIPKHYTWNKSTRKWNRRKQGKIRGRMVFANPAEGERFYLCVLLQLVKGHTGFDYIYTVNDWLYTTFHRAALERGLIKSDDYIHACLSMKVFGVLDGDDVGGGMTIVSGCSDDWEDEGVEKVGGAGLWMAVEVAGKF